MRRRSWESSLFNETPDCHLAHPAGKHAAQRLYRRRITYVGADRKHLAVEAPGDPGSGAGNPVPNRDDNPIVINEYGWLWLNRDGTPTELTGNVYADLTGPNATAEERFAMNGYLLGGLTELPPEENRRATWVLSKENGEWLVKAFQNVFITEPKTET